MALQASVYQSEGADDMEEFFASARQAISDPALREILESFAA